MADRLAATINWNGGAFLRPMIESLLPQLEETGMELLVFDNGSTDGSPEMVEELFSATGPVRVYKNPENIGFGRAANRIVEEAAGETVVLMNTDTVVMPGCLKVLLRCMDEHPEVAFAGPMLLWPDGTLQSSRRDFPFPLKLLMENTPVARRFTAKHSSHLKAGYTDWLVGAMMAVRREPFLEAGGFSRDFLFFHEETDLQYTLWRNGWKVWFEPAARVIHHQGGSCRKAYGETLYLQHIPGKLLFLRRHGTGLDGLLYRILMSGLQLKRMCQGALGSQKDVRWSGPYCRTALRMLWRRERA